MTGEAPRVAVVGAGLAGLAATRVLRSKGFEVTLIERGRWLGGRLSTRPGPGGGLYDLGPQYLLPPHRPGDRFTFFRSGIESGRLRQFLREKGQLGLLRDTQVNVVAPAGAAGPDDLLLPFPGTAVNGGMQRLADLLSPPPPTSPEGVDYRNQTAVIRVERVGRRWKLHTRHVVDDTEETVTADAVLLTPPVPVALELLRASGTDIPTDLRDQLKGVSYTRRFVVTARFAGPAFPAGQSGVRVLGSPVEWVTDNEARGVSPAGPALSAVADAAWSAQHWAEADQAVLDQLVPLMLGWADGPPQSPALHRWEYAEPENPLAIPCAVAVQDPPLVFAGDGFAASAPYSVDAAFTSGTTAADWVVRLFGVIQKREKRFAKKKIRRILLEVPVTGVEEATTAASLGADRLELGCALEVGGLTPSRDTFLAVRAAVRVPVYVLLRPRAGGFTYSPLLMDAMRRDAEWFVANGADGIVFGILDCQGGQVGIAHDWCKPLVESAAGRAVFHRAFDFLPDPFAALDELHDLGFERVLTSGGHATAEAGASRLEALVTYGGWRIEVLPCGGITPGTVADLLRTTKADQVHAGLRSPVPDPTLLANPRLGRLMGVPDPEWGWYTTDPELVREMRQALDNFARREVEEDEEGAG